MTGVSDPYFDDPPLAVGVDPSLTATAVCVHTASGRTDLRVSKTKPAGKDTHSKLSRMLRQAAFPNDFTAYAQLVVIEGPSFSSKGAATRDLAGLWWLMYRELSTMGCRVAVVSPNTLKLWATGKGNADKFQVGQHIAKRWPHMELDSDDQADALVLASIGLHRLRLLPWEPTAYQVKALRKVEWPADAAAEAS